MNRGLAVSVALFLTVPAGSAPEQKDAPAPIYHPTTVGDKIVHAVKDDDKNTEYTYTVEKVETKDGAVTVTTSRKPGDVTRKVRLSATELLLISDGTKDHDPPVTLLRLPAKPGDAWDSTPRAAKLGTITGYTSKVVGDEEVEVPAGKFKAIRVDSVISLSGTRTKVSEWYAPGVGLVKKQTGPDQWEALKSFTPGK